MDLIIAQLFRIVLEDAGPDEEGSLSLLLEDRKEPCPIKVLQIFVDSGCFLVTTTILRNDQVSNVLSKTCGILFEQVFELRLYGVMVAGETDKE